MMKPILIPTYTGRKINGHKENPERCLVSVNFSTAANYVKGTKLTIIDCLTYALYRKFSSLDPMLHYTWLICWIKENEHLENHVFVAPDFDWLPKQQVKELTDLWEEAYIKAPCLGVYGKILYDRIENMVGHAVVPYQEQIAHPKWTHTFSSNVVPLIGETELWTYDTR